MARHSFGGSALDRYIFEFEAPDSGGAAPVGEPAAPAEPAESAWTGPSQDEWEATQQQLQQYAELLAPPPPDPYQQQQGPPPVPDPFSETYAQDFQAYTEALVAPYQQFQQTLQLQEAEERGMEILDHHAETLGEFDRTTAWARANMLIGQYGNDPRAAERALEQAAKETREYEQRIGQAYYDAQVQQIQNVAGAPRTMPAGVGGSQTVVSGGYGNVPGAVVKRFFG